MCSWYSDFLLVHWSRYVSCINSPISRWKRVYVKQNRLSGWTRLKLNHCYRRWHHNKTYMTSGCKYHWFHHGHRVVSSQGEDDIRRGPWVLVGDRWRCLACHGVLSSGLEKPANSCLSSWHFGFVFMVVCILHFLRVIRTKQAFPYLL